jgi:DNA mismatch repair protein MutS
MEYTKEIFVKDYFEIHNFYSNIYGHNRTIILMQVGSFHECYCTDTDGLNLVELSQKIDVICTKKNGKEPVSKSNPRMLGFPIHVTDIFIQKLLDLNYTVIKIDQTSDPPKPKREVVGIFSPATFIDNQLNSQKTNYIVSIVIDKIKQNQICLGIASYDLSTGNGSFFETYSNPNDPMIALDDANRYLDTCPPKEIILVNNLNENDKINNMNISGIIGYLNLEDKLLFDYNQNKNNKLSYQKIIFDKVFPGYKDIFESLNLHLYNWARFALTNLYDYAQNHQMNLINKLKLPVEFQNKSYLYLGNHSLDQLNVFTNNSKEKSLFQIINNTKTILGKRFLNDTLGKPLIDKDSLNLRYEQIDKIIKNSYYNNFNNLLEDISDIDRLIRKMELGSMHPFELNLLYLSLYQIDKLTDFCNENKIFDIDSNYNVKSITDHITNTFHLDLIVGLNFNNLTDYDNNIFKKGKCLELDELMEELSSSSHFMDNLIDKLQNYVESVQLKYNDRDGHYLYLTNRRCEVLKKNLEKVKTLEIGKHKINVSDLEFVALPKSTYTKINCKRIKEISDVMVIQKNKIAKIMKDKFKEEIINISNIYNNILIYWGKKISYIDFINSGAVTAIKNHYTKPEIKEHNESYFNSKNMRHPIVEFISNDSEYKPQSISLGGPNELSGILLYGINSSGKSTLMKSIGLNIVLAQIGYFVASEKFTYNPYKSLFTRINGNDNIYRGLSSFMVELTEITSILKRNNSNTLVIADELCRGTEQISANIIVSYLLKTLSESRTSFITATHLHEITNLETVKALKNVKPKHIKITYDESNDCLIYNRELLDGQGESFYGLQVAKFMMKDKYFNETTNNILNEYYNVKQSKYNSDSYLINCHICNSKDNLETHHITFQKDFNDKLINDNKLHYQKDANYNLVTLCQSCHDEIDRNKIIINGWTETSQGRKLDYFVNEEQIKQSKYSDELLNYIKCLKNETTDVKMARIKIKEKYNKKISSKSILNIWK